MPINIIYRNLLSILQQANCQYVRAVSKMNSKKTKIT
ncbi:hypothetical protein PT2222_140095 [Paraburkholderia tropica]